MRDSLVDRERGREGGRGERERERGGERASVQEFCVRKYDFINHWVHMQKTSLGKNIMCLFFEKPSIPVGQHGPKSSRKGSWLHGGQGVLDG